MTVSVIMYLNVAGGLRVFRRWYCVAAGWKRSRGLCEEWFHRKRRRRRTRVPMGEEDGLRSKFAEWITLGRKDG